MRKTNLLSSFALITLLLTLTSEAKGEGRSLYQIHDGVCLGVDLKQPIENNGPAFKGSIRYINRHLPWGVVVEFQQFLWDCYTPESGEPICHDSDKFTSMTAVGPWTWQAPIEVFDTFKEGMPHFAVVITFPDGHRYVEKGLPSGYEGTTFPFVTYLADAGQQMTSIRIMPTEGFRVLKEIGMCQE